MTAPIAFFAYNRPERTQEALGALNNNYMADCSDLFIFSDAPKTDKERVNVENVRKIISEFSGKSKFRSLEIIEANTNKGLAKSIIEGVSDIIDKNNRIIVLEDDLITEKDFLCYMNMALDFYEDDDSIGAISGYSLPLKCLKHYNEDVYVSGTGNSWGWATWGDIWKETDWKVNDYADFKINKKERRKFDKRQYGISRLLDLQMEGKIDSWAVRWDYSFYRRALYTLYPTVSKLRNNGFDNDGTHCTLIDEKKYRSICEEKKITLTEVHINKYISRKTAAYYKSNLIKKLLHAYREKKWEIKKRL